MKLKYCNKLMTTNLIERYGSLTHNGITYQNLSQYDLGHSQFKMYRGTIIGNPPIRAVVTVYHNNIEQHEFRETTALEILSRESIICKRYTPCLITWFKKDGFLYIITKMITGFYALEYIRHPTAPRPLRTVHGGVSLAVNLCKGLDYIHRLGIYNLNISPKTIKLDSTDNLPKFVSWGQSCGAPIVAKKLPGDFESAYGLHPEPDEEIHYYRGDQAASFLGNTCMEVGYESYAPPEKMDPTDEDSIFIKNGITLEENKVGKAHDIWSLGCFLLEWYSEVNNPLRRPGEYEVIDYYKLSRNGGLQGYIYAVFDSRFTYGLVSKMLTINPEKRLLEWNRVMRIVDRHCNREPGDVACPSKEETREINHRVWMARH